ncbi:MAG: tetratricopeptide repeat protein [Kiritimatiellales bacterium]
MSKHKKILLSAVILITVCCISVFIDLAVSGRKEVRLVDEATGLYERGDYQAARPKLIKSLRDNPSNETVCRMLGEIYESERNYPVALVYYRRAAALNPLDDSLRPKLVQLSAVTGEFGQVLNLLKKDFSQGKLTAEELLDYLEVLMMTGDRAAVEDSLPARTDGAAPQLILLYGILQMDDGNYAAALRDFDSILDQEISVPLRYRALSLSATAAGMAGNDPLAEERLKAAAELVPCLGTYTLALFYLNRDDTVQAQNWLEKCLEALPGHVPARLALTDIYADRHDLNLLKTFLEAGAPRSRAEQECRNYLKAAIALYEQRYKDVQALLLATPLTANRLGHQTMKFEALVSSGTVDGIVPCVDLILRINRTEQVRAYLQQRLSDFLISLVGNRQMTDADRIAMTLVPLSNDAGLQDLMPTWKVLLLGALERHDYTPAKLYASTMLRCEPENPLAALSMGEVLLATWHPDEAVEYLNRLPDSLPVLYDRAKACLMQGDDAGAEQIYRVAWKTFPGDLMLFNAYADFLFKRQRGTEVIPMISQLPDSTEADYVSSLTRARLAETARDGRAAKREYSAALDLLQKLPGTPKRRYQQAYLYASTGQDAEAAELYRQLLKDFPDDQMILVNLSEVEAALGNASEAVALAKKAARLYPDAPEVRTCLARRQAESAEDPAAKPD